MLAPRRALPPHQRGEIEQGRASRGPWGATAERTGERREGCSLRTPPPRSRGLLLPVTAAVVWGAEVASPNLLCPPRPLRLLKCDQPFSGK